MGTSKFNRESLQAKILTVLESVLSGCSLDNDAERKIVAQTLAVALTPAEVRAEIAEMNLERKG